MRSFLVAALFAAMVPPAVPVLVSPASAQEGCTGENCPPPASGGHDCEHEKKDETVS